MAGAPRRPQEPGVEIPPIAENVDPLGAGLSAATVGPTAGPELPSNDVQAAPQQTVPPRKLAPATASDSSPDEDLNSFILGIDSQNKVENADRVLDDLIGPDESTIPTPVKKIGPFEKAGTAFADVMYKAPAKGARDAVQETIDLISEVDTQISSYLPDFVNEARKSNYMPAMLDPVGALKKMIPDGAKLPDPGEPTSGVGQVVKGITQFVVGFAGAGKVLGPIKALKAAPYTASVLKGFAGTFAAFDGHQNRLGNLIEDLDGDGKLNLAQDVATYLKAEEDDPELLGRLKGAIEDMGAGLVVDGVVAGIRALRAASKVKKVTNATTFEEAAKGISSGRYLAELKAANQPVDAVDKLLGSTSGTFVVRAPEDIPVSTISPQATPGPLPPIVKANDTYVPVTSQPIRVEAFHGTTAIFDQWDPAKLGSGVGGAEVKHGFMFTRNTDVANDYALTTEFGSPNVRPVVLDLKNPKIIKDDEILTFDPLKAKEAEKAKAEGHDSVIFRAEDGDGDTMGKQDIFLVFDPKNIKPQFEQAAGDYVTGQPASIKAYHGTKRSFDKFDPEQLGSNTNMADNREGFFFSKSPETAESYSKLGIADVEDIPKITDEQISKLDPKIAQQWREISESTIKAEKDRWNYILKNTPENATDEQAEVVYNSEEYLELSGLVDEGISMLDGMFKDHLLRGSNIRPSNISMKNPLVYDAKGESVLDFARIDILTGAKEAGHDGVIFKNTKDMGPAPDDLYVPFSADQIKSQFEQALDEADSAISTSGEATAGMAPATYAGQTVHVNFNKIDTPDDLRTAISDLVTNKPVRNNVDPLTLKEPSSYVLVGKKMYTGKTHEEAVAKVAAEFGPGSTQVKMLNMPENKALFTGTYDPKTGFRGADPSIAIKQAKETPQPQPFADATVPGSERAWNLLVASRDRRAKTGQSPAMVKEEQEALQSLWNSASNKLNEIIQITRKAPTSENLFAFRKMMSTFGVINNELMGIRHETNRQVNIWRKSDRIPMQRMKEIEETLERTGGVADNKALLDTIANHIDSDPNAAIALAKMSQNSRRYGTVRALRNAWTLGLLTNWKTHEVNAISNTFMMFQVAAERGAAARYSALMGDTNGVEIGEATAMLAGMWDNLADAMRNAGRTFMSGEGGGAFQKIEQGFEHNVFEDADTNLKKFMNTSMWYWGGIGRALQAGDEFFKTLNYGAATNALIHRQVAQEIRSGTVKESNRAMRITHLKNNVPEDIMLKGEDLARYATFTQEPGSITKSFAHFINKVPGGRYIIPFINTPTNLFKASIERTPFAPLQKQFRDAIRRGGADEAIAMSKLTMGTSLLAMSMGKAFEGEITGSGPPFWSKEYAQWKAQGKQPYSFKKGDKWIAYNRFDPMGMVLGLGADMSEKLKAIDEFEGESAAEYQKLLAGVTFSLASQVGSKTYMQGIANFFDAWENPEIAANNMANMFAGSLIPAGVAEVARQVDPTQRQAYDFITKWKTRLPGKSAELEPKLDMWAREIPYGTGNALVDAVNPLSVTKENITPIDHEFNLQGWSIPGDVKEFDREKVTISLRDRPQIKNYLLKTERATIPSEMADQNNKYVKQILKRYGDYTMHDLMNMIVTGNHPLYRKYAQGSEGPKGGKVAMLEKIRSVYLEAAKDMTVIKFPELEIDIIDEQARREERAVDIGNERRRRDAAGDTP